MGQGEEIGSDQRVLPTTEVSLPRASRGESVPGSHSTLKAPRNRFSVPFSLKVFDRRARREAKLP